MKKLLALLILLALTVPAHAYNLDLGASGQNDSYMLNLSARETFGEIGAGIAGRYGKNGGETTANQTRLRLSLDHDFSDKWALWADEQAVNDRVLNRVENFAGIGLKLTFIRTDRWKADVSAGPLYHYTRHDNGDEDSMARYSLRGRVKWKHRDNMASLTVFYQPNTADSEDYIAKAIAEAGAKMGEKSTLKLRVEGEHRSVLPRDDRNTITGMLVLSVEG
jgi:hypothetical protein